jgi:hypothetical protein
MEFDDSTARPVSIDQFDDSTAQPVGTFSRSIGRGTGNLISSAGAALKDVTDIGGIASGIEGYGERMAARNPAEVTDVAGVLEKPLTFAGQALGEQVPQFGLNIAGAAAGAKLGSRFGGQGAIVGGIAGGLMPTFVQEYGSIRQEQAHTGIDDKGRAVAAALPATALELLGPEAIAIRNIVKVGGKLTAEQAAKLGGELAADGSRLAHMGKEAVKSVGQEAVTEVAQTGLERMGAGQDVTGAEATNDYIMSGLAGGIAGGVFGGGAAAFTPREKSQTVDPVAQQAQQQQQGIAQATAIATTDPNAGPLTKAVGLNPGAAAQAGAAGILGEQVEKADGPVKSLDGEFKAFQKQQAADEKAQADVMAAFEDFDAAVAAGQMRRQFEAQPKALPAPTPESNVIEGEFEDVTPRGPIITPPPEKRAALPAPGDTKPGGEIVVGQDGGARKQTYDEAARAEQQRAEADSISGDATGIKAPVKEVRRPDGTAWTNHLAAAAALRKRSDAAEFEVKRIDKGQFVLARKGEPAKQENTDGEVRAPEMAAASDGRQGADAPGGVADSPLGANAGERGAAAAESGAGAATAVPVGSAQPEPAPALTGYKRDNPGGNWITAKQKHAELLSQTSTDPYLQKMLGGTTTASADPVALPLEELAKLPSATDKDQGKIDRLTEKVKAEGWKQDDPIRIAVNQKGEPYIVEGNARIAVAQATGQKTVNTEVKWQNGGEDAQGFTPARVAELSKATPQEQSNAEATREEPPLAQRQEQAAAQTDTVESEAAPEEGAAANPAEQASKTPAVDAAPTSADIRRADGTPFPNKLAAGAARAKAGQKETHTIEPVDGGFVLRPKTTKPETSNEVQQDPAEEGAAQQAAAEQEAAPEGAAAADPREGAGEEAAGGPARAEDRDVLTPEAAKSEKSDQRASESGAESEQAQQPARRAQPGEPGYTLTDARNDLIELRSQVEGQGRVVDDRLLERMRQQERLVQQMETADQQPAAQQPEANPQATPAPERTAREYEREAYTFAVSLDEIQQAAAGERAAFDAKAAETLRAAGYEKFAADADFLSSLYKEARKRQKEAEREKGRDPAIYQAQLAQAIAAANLPEGEHEAFKLGFDHALAGRTKSTITGESKLAGYEAARAWLKTPEGRAFFEGKRVNKLENTGADLRRWFDKAKKDAEAANLKSELAAEKKAAAPASEQKADDDEPMQSTEAQGRGDPAAYAVATGMQPQAVLKELTDALGEQGVKNLIRAGVLRILPSREYFPAEIKAFVNKMSGRTLGLYDPRGKRAYIVANEIKPGEAVKTLMHEVGEHYGLSTMMGKDGYDRLLNDVRGLNRMGNKAVVEAWNRVAKNYKHLAPGSEKFVREVIAHLGERPDALKQPIIKRIIQAVRRFLYQHGFKVKLSDEDVVGMVVASLRRTMSQPVRQSQQKTAGEPAQKLDEPLFSLADERAPGVMSDIRDRIAELNDTRRTFNGWWHKTVGTQYHKAQIDNDFGRVFNRGQDYLTDVSRIALGAADAAPEILPRFESLKDLAKSGASPRELKPVAEAIFRGTLEDQKVYTDAELRDRFKLNPKQIRLYRQARAAFNRSLEDMAIAEMVKLARNDVGDKVAREAAAAGSMNAARDILTREAPELAKELDQKIGRVRQLISEGYAPLMRFGRYSVYVVGKDGEQLFFGMFEDEADARKVEKEMREQYPDAKVQRGVVSEESFKMFQGLSPDTLELFADVTGMSQNEAFQQYLKVAVNNRSALKRLIKRKGIEGYNPDLKRVMAQFITSNARTAAGNLHLGEMAKAWADIPKEKGDVKDEAAKLIGYLQNPQEEAAALRSFLFFNFLGGSIASAAVNMTQPLTMTLPYLSQWGARRAAGEMGKAMKAATGTIQDPALRAAMDRAMKEGIVEPHQIHELQGAAMTQGRDMGPADPAREALRKAVFVWGRLFSWAEQFNRRVTFAAAYQIGRKLSPDELEKAGAKDAYEFAVKAVNETQGIYNRGNRPDWARGALGATLFTFKQFSISYLEFLKRLPRRERVIALGVLFLAAGLNGLPGMDDLDDLIDTLAQSLGFSFNTKQERDKLIRAAITPILGAGAADFIQNGISAALPIDVQGRMGLQNLIPGTGIALKSQQDKGREMIEAAGPAAGFAEDMVGLLGRGAQAGRALLSGDAAGAGSALWSAGKESAPVAVQNALKGMEMAQLGFYRDEKGRRVLDTDGADALFKSIGFQPASVAKESRAVQLQRQNIALNKATEAEIADEWAQGVFEKDPAKSQRARERLLDWNKTNPESPIRIMPQQIQRRVKEMQMTRAQRFIKTAPKELRGQVQRELALE